MAANALSMDYLSVLQYFMATARTSDGLRPMAESTSSHTIFLQAWSRWVENDLNTKFPSSATGIQRRNARIGLQMEFEVKNDLKFNASLLFSVDLNVASKISTIEGFQQFSIYTWYIVVELQGFGYSILTSISNVPSIRHFGPP